MEDIWKFGMPDMYKLLPAESKLIINECDGAGVQVSYRSLLHRREKERRR